MRVQRFLRRLVRSRRARLARLMRRHFQILSTPSQILSDFLVFFTPVPIPAGSCMLSLLYAHAWRIPSLLSSRPIHYWGVFRDLALMFACDLSGWHIVRYGVAYPIRAAMGRLRNDLPADHAAILAAAQEAGIEAPTQVSVPWYRVPILALDFLLQSNFYELYFMRDHGRGYGECVVLYGTTRRDSRHRIRSGYYVKVEFYGVPHNDPSRWWEYRSIYGLGVVCMRSWGSIPGDLPHRL